MSDNKGYTPRRNDATPSTFKTPKSVRTLNNRDVFVSKRTSDSEESTKSDGASDDGSSCNSEDLSIVAEFDELMRFSKMQTNEEVETRFLEFVEGIKELHNSLCCCQDECQRLRRELEKRTQDCSDLEGKLGYARKLLDQESKRSRKILEERDSLEEKISKVVDLLFKNNKNSISDEVRQQLASFNNRDSFGIPQLSTIQEVNTTGSLLSDLSYSRSEDDLDVSTLPSKGWKKHRPSLEPGEEPASKKRRSAGSKFVEINSTDTVRATTTLTVGKSGPITATSIIESVPPESNVASHAPFKKTSRDVRPSAPPEHLLNHFYPSNSPRCVSNIKQRQHTFQAKTTVLPEICNICEKRIGFGKAAYKCKDCRILCHTECKPLVPLPCIPSVNTPTQKGVVGLLADYVPTIPPMVPPLIVRCIKEVEARGLNEIGIYRVPGSEKEVKALKEKFLKGKGIPCLSDVDIHVICGTIKFFLRSLSEPVITYARWLDFSRAVEIKDKMDMIPILYQIISELPKPNQDTLAYVILHLKRVSASPRCKMPIENLARIFGPTLIGYSSSDVSPASAMYETNTQYAVMESLMNLPDDYWESFVNFNPPQWKNLQQTPSTDSLLGGASSGLFTPRRKKQKIFPTPPL